MSARLKANHVFINCPFDSRYKPIFNAIVFSVYDLGFVARCSLPEDDAAEFRLAKIERMGHRKVDHDIGHRLDRLAIAHCPLLGHDRSTKSLTHTKVSS